MLIVGKNYIIIEKGGDAMPDYKEMYFTLFREVTKIIDQLQEIQQKTEEMYIDSDDNALLFSTDKTEK